MGQARERRAEARLDERHKVSLTVLSCPGEPSLKGRTFTGYTRNVSAGGLLFYARRPLPVGTAVALRVEFVRPHEVALREGRVLWGQTPSGRQRVIVGVRFMDSSRDTVLAWKRLLAKRTAAG